MRVGVIDCGTNTVRLLIADAAPDASGEVRLQLGPCEVVS